MRVTLTTPVHTGTLLTEIKAVVPTAVSVTDHGTDVEIGGTFTAAEETQVHTLVLGHDGVAAKAAINERIRLRREAMAQSPKTLSVVQRLDRIERVLGLEGD